MLGNPNLRAQAGCTATSNLFFSVTFSIFLVFLVREVELSPGVIGVLFSVGSVGSLIAAFTTTRITKRFGIGPTTIAAAFLNVPGDAAHRARTRRASRSRSSQPQGSSLGFVIVVYNITQVTYRQAICPPRLQGRMNSVMRFLVWGTIPIGALAGGALGTWIGLRETIVDRCGRLRALRSSGSCSRHSGTSARCPSRSRTSRGRRRRGATLPGVADPLSPVDDPA